MSCGARLVGDCATETDASSMTWLSANDAHVRFSTQCVAELLMFALWHDGCDTLGMTAVR